jgi:hypothetical protein
MTGELTFLPQSGLGMSMRPIDDGISISSGDGETRFRLTNGANGNIVLLPVSSGTLALTSDIDALASKVMPRYPFVDAAIVSPGVINLEPFKRTAIKGDDSLLVVNVAGTSDSVRDIIFVVDCRKNLGAPTLRWGDEETQTFHPRTDAETDMACVDGAINVYWISEFSPNQFVVAGWQMTDPVVEGGGE